MIMMIVVIIIFLAVHDMGELPKSNAVADEHDSSNDTGSDGESHETSNLLKNADLSQNEKSLSIIQNGNNMWHPHSPLCKQEETGSS